jgi:hypothetical protein
MLNSECPIDKRAMPYAEPVKADHFDQWQKQAPEYQE